MAPEASVMEPAAMVSVPAEALDVKVPVAVYNSDQVSPAPAANFAPV